MEQHIFSVITMICIFLSCTGTKSEDVPESTTEVVIEKISDIPVPEGYAADKFPENAVKCGSSGWFSMEG